jgi:TerC family integral membrane protein
MVVQTQRDVPIDADDLPGYAGRLWEQMRRDPHPLRIGEWDRLERDGAGMALEAVRQADREKLAAVVEGQRRGVVDDSVPAAILLRHILALIHTGFSADDPAGYRAAIMFLFFGLLLIWTAVQLFRHRGEEPSVEDNSLVKLARRFLPVSSDYDGGKLVTTRDGRRLVTPLFIALVAIGGSDLLFALDSIPAVFGVTSEAYIVFAANAFALLGLRALFFLVKGLLDRLVYLSTGLSVILALIGAKLVLHWAHTDLSPSVPEIGTAVSLGVIVVVLAVTTVTSLIKARERVSS